MTEDEALALLTLVGRLSLSLMRLEAELAALKAQQEEATDRP